MGKSKSVVKLSRSNMEKKVEDSVESIIKVISEKTTILLFVGNGISPNELNTIRIPEDFIEYLKTNNPRDYISLLDDAEIFVGKYLSQSEISGVKMDDFLEKLNKFDDIKKKFYSYLKLLCCRAKPTETHYSLYSFCCLLNSLQYSKFPYNRSILRIFTTNYDNLIEKAYLQRYEMWMDRFVKEQTIVNNEKLRKEFDNLELRPDFLYDFEDIEYKPKSLLIVPIHNSIRATQCENCKATMTSETIGMGEQYCINCGNKLPEFIIPTEEGRTNQSVYKLFMDEVNKAQVIIFIGHSFSDSDQHIMNDIVSNLNSSKGPKKLIINLCRKSLDQDKEFKKCKNTKYELFDILYDMPDSIDYYNYILCEKIKDKIPELFKVWSGIYEINKNAEKIISQKK